MPPAPILLLEREMLRKRFEPTSRMTTFAELDCAHYRVNPERFVT